jgi:glucose/mannose transport system substrate-binding protein
MKLEGASLGMQRSEGSAGVASGEVAGGLRVPAFHPDAQRLKRLLTTYLAPVTRHVERLGVPSAEVDDVAQEAFLVAASKIGGVPSEQERAFLFGVVTHVAQNARRAKMRRHRAYEQFSDVAGEPAPSQEELMDHFRTRFLADSVLRGMSPELRGIFLLCEVEGLAVPEVAQRLALPTGTAASRLRRARKAFLERFTRASLPPRQRATLAAQEASPKRVADRGLEILSWWVNDGEVEALGALIDMFRRGHPGAAVTSSGIRETSLAKNRLNFRMASGSPPDTFQSNGGRDLLQWARGGGSAPAGHIEPLEFMFENERWRSAFPKEVLELVTFGGEAYAVPLNIHRTNSLFCDRNALAQADVDVPRTLDELHQAAGTLRRRGVEPLAIGSRDPWVLTMIAFEHILVALAGPAFYRDFCEGNVSPGAPELRAAVDELGRLLEVCNHDASDLSWDRAADRVRIGGAAMTLMGDWAKGYFERRGFLESEGFVMAPSPGTDGYFVFTMDAFGLPKGAVHREDTLDLLRIFGSEQGQSVFSRIKGSRPARANVASSPREDGAAGRRDFDRSVHVPTMTCLVSSEFSAAMDRAFGVFATTRDVSAVLKVIDREYARIR